MVAADLVPSQLSEDQSSTDESIIFETRWYEVFIAPDDGVVEWRTLDDEAIVTARDSNFTEWTIARKDANVVFVDLDNGATVEVFGLGPGRLKGARARFDLVDVPDVSENLNVDGPLDGSLRGVSDADWDVTNEALTVASGATFTVFDEGVEPAEVAARFNRLGASELVSGPANIIKLARVYSRGYWADVAQAEEDLRAQIPPAEKTKGFLGQYAKDWGVERRADESDASLLIRLKGRLKRLRGGVQPKSLRSFVAAFLDADPSNITIIENEDLNDGHYTGARFEVQFSTTLLTNLGFEAPFTSIVNDIDEILEAATAAGVKGLTNLLTASVWESGNLLENPNFEDYDTSPGLPPEWDNNTGASTTFEREESNVDDGLFALKVTAAGGTSEEGVEQPIEGFVGGNAHTATVRARTGGSSGEVPKLVVRNVTDGTVEGSDTGTDGSTSYETLSVSFTPSDGKEYVIELVHDGTPSASEVVIFDEARVSDDTSGAMYDGSTTDVYGS